MYIIYQLAGLALLLTVGYHYFIRYQSPKRKFQRELRKLKKTYLKLNDGAIAIKAQMVATRSSDPALQEAYDTTVKAAQYTIEMYDQGLHVYRLTYNETFKG